MIFQRNRDQKKVFLFGKLFTIRRLSAFDFIEGNGIPISLFSMTGDGGRDASKSILKAIKTDDEKKKEKETQREIVKKVLSIAVVKPKNFKPGSLKWDQAFILYAVILDFSLNKVKRLFEIPKNTVIILDAIAKRYGKTPAEILSGSFEDNMLNYFVGINAITNEVEIRNKEIEERKKLQARAGRK